MSVESALKEIIQRLTALEEAVSTLNGKPVAKADTGGLPAYADGFDLGVTNGQPFRNTLLGGQSHEFKFEVLEGQKRVEITMGEVGDMGTFLVNAKIVDETGELEVTYNGDFLRTNKLVDYIGATQQRAGAESQGKDWPHGAGRFALQVYVAKTVNVGVLYNH